jgi:hypothetical protein
MVSDDVCTDILNQISVHDRMVKNTKIPNFVHSALEIKQKSLQLNVLCYVFYPFI